MNVQSETEETNMDPSVHLTVGVDTHIWGLNFASLRDTTFKRAGVQDKILLTKLEEELYWDLQVREREKERENKCVEKRTDRL